MANIMIVDDSEHIVKRLRAILEELGHQVIAEANNGREAVDRYDPGKVDLVTMDIQMPVMDGIEAVRHIRGKHPHAVIVMVSSVEDRGKVFEAIKLGAKNYILKPFVDDKVKKVLQDALGVTMARNSVDPSAQADSATPVASEISAIPGKVPDALELQPVDVASLPFELFHLADRTVLIIQRHLHRQEAEGLRVCLQGLLFFRKMKLVVECWEPLRDDRVLRMLLDFASAVREQKGLVGFVTDNASFYSALQSQWGAEVYREYKEIKW
ncbi:MAG: response regulator [Paenibacillaceae bacterium]|jgi:two-component system chemotaxis response regulator CheY|nr:response regulator [Paenibacillaceae bacterium]